MMVCKQGNWLIAKVGDHFVMMSTDKVHHIGITEVSARIWELIETLHDVGAVCAQLGKEYAIAPDVCRAEVDAFLCELVQEGAVVLDQPAAA
jgi:hypothetical protein